jgi:hypothetical protein
MKKSTFICREGTFAPTVMPFGLTNAPAVFINLLDTILADLKYDVCLAYVDDIIVWSHTEQEHLCKLSKLFERLAGENLKLRPTKCHFMYSHLNILGVKVQREGVSPDPLKLTGVTKLQPPKNAHQARQVLSLFSYFRKFIPKFSTISHPLQLLTAPSRKFKWDAAAEESFEKLKAIITSAPILAHFDPKKEAILGTDASLLGLGGCLMQMHGDQQKPCAFVSRTLSKAEKNYTTMELELTAIAWCLQKFRNLIFGVPVKIYTDNHASCYLLRSTKKELSPKLSRIALTMMEYNIIGIHHVSGAKHQVADCLSRFPTEAFNPSEDDIHDIPLFAIDSLDMPEIQRSDPEIAEIISSLTSAHLPRLKINFLIKDNVLFYRNSKHDKNVLVVPRALIADVLQECHDSYLSSHLGIAKTYDKVRKRYWWPRLRQDVIHHVKTCHDCQLRKVLKQKPQGQMQFFEVPEQIFSRVQIDVSGPFPTSKRQNKLIITACDYLTKWVEARAVRRADTDTLVKFFCRADYLPSQRPKNCPIRQWQHIYVRLLQSSCQTIRHQTAFEYSVPSQKSGSSRTHPRSHQ